jgi:uncharacterized membrane protein YedE/YeeE
VGSILPSPKKSLAGTGLAGTGLAGSGLAWAGLAGAGLVALALARVDGRTSLLWLAGCALGYAVVCASVSFAGAFRALFAEGRGVGLRMQAIMLGLGASLFLPALALGTIGDQPLRGFVFPVGLALALGAFLFGVGMQLGGGCASGALCAVGGGQGLRMWATLIAFVGGATFAAYDVERWSQWPALPPISLPDRLGAPGAWLASLGAVALLWAASVLVERRRRGEVEPLVWRRAPGGGWPLVWGAVALALLNFATLLIAGRPWAITAAFPLWGSKALEALTLADPAFWPFWEDPTRTEAFLRPVWLDRTSLMDAGMILGAALAALSRGRPADFSLPALRPLAAAVLGGGLLGYGATIGSGCNISAYFSGFSSGSLHGWVWIFPALAGNWLGLRLRPAFGLSEK